MCCNIIVVESGMWTAFCNHFFVDGCLQLQNCSICSTRHTLSNEGAKLLCLAAPVKFRSLNSYRRCTLPGKHCQKNIRHVLFRVPQSDSEGNSYRTILPAPGRAIRRMSTWYSRTDHWDWCYRIVRFVWGFIHPCKNDSRCASWRKCVAYIESMSARRLWCFNALDSRRRKLFKRR